MPVNHLLYTHANGTTWYKKKRIPSAIIGRSGITHNKNEGDMATPSGVFFLQTIYYRPDRVAQPYTLLPTIALLPNMGWCDDIHHPQYNQPITLPFPASHEKLWRNTHVYDYIITTSHNQNPTVAGAGSAIFIHIAGDKDYTEGCLAMDAKTLVSIIAKATPNSTWCVESPRTYLK